jgi:hypothetical protein
MSSPSSGADPNQLMERAGERCLIIKSRLNRDLDQRHAGLAHQLFGMVNAMLHQPLVSGDAERSFEGAGKVAYGKSAFARNVRKLDPGMHVLMKEFRRSSLLPWRQTALRMPCCSLLNTVLLEKMCPEDEAELIESQHREAVASPKEWKNAFRDPGHNY